MLYKMIGIHKLCVKISSITILMNRYEGEFSKNGEHFKRTNIMKSPLKRKMVNWNECSQECKCVWLSGGRQIKWNQFS